MEDKVRKYIEQHPGESADAVYFHFIGKIKRDEVRVIYKKVHRAKEKPEENEELLELRNQLKSYETIEKGYKIHHIEPSKTKGTKTEGTVVMVASDWHIEEAVDPETVNNLNSYNLEESRRRADIFFRSGLKLANMFGQDLDVKNIVIGLLGDFFSNDIHEELAEINLLLPMDACLKAQEYIASGIEFLLANSDYNLTFVCCSGNHARDTEKVHYSTEAGHSLEYMMYHNLAQRYEGNPRVKFIIKVGYHAYLNILGQMVRFHHGHSLRYQGGISGLFVPAYKMISKWNNAIKADLDVFGHFHQYVDGRTFISNGSLIGYNAYALRNGLAFERPQQACFVIDAKRGRTISAPILFQ